VEPHTDDAKGGTSAEVRSVVLAVPILPGKEEGWRRFVQDLLASGPEGYEGLRRRLGLRAERVWLTRTARREVAFACVEAEVSQGALRRLCASKEPFDAWFKEMLLELHGLDLGRLRQARHDPELIFGRSTETEGGDGADHS
jgi:hypothetical protein